MNFYLKGRKMTKLRLVKGKGRARTRLTAKQSKFLDLILGIGVENAYTYTAAYKSAYDCKKMSDANIRKEAHLLFHSPNFSPFYEERKRQLEETRLTQSLGRRDKIITALEQESRDFENGSPTSRVRALELLGKIREVNLFSNNHVIEDESKSADQIKKELDDKIRLLLGE